MTTTQIWADDWQSRIKSRIQRCGYECTASFLQAYPNIPLFKVARVLGSDVAAVQLAILYFAEASNSNDIKTTASDLLCRVLHSNLRKGWNGGVHADRMMAAAYSEWLSTMEFRTGTAELRQVAEHTWSALEKSNPETGWLPRNFTDTRIVEAINHGWDDSLRKP
jgi:hypothetical protein